MRRFVASTAFASLLVLAPRAEATTHPSLLFGKDDIPKIQARLAGPLAAVADGLKAGVNGVFDGGGVPAKPDLTAWAKLDDRRAIADTLQSFAFSAVMFRDDAKVGPRAKQLAHDYLVGICAYSDWVFAADQGDSTPDLYLAHMLYDVSLAYDWLYDDLTESERSACRAAVAREAPKMYAVGKLPGGTAWWLDEYLQNHHWINNSSLGVAALAFDGELSADTAPWLSNTQKALEPVDTVLDPIAGGAWHEGPGYAGYGLDTLIPFSRANHALKGGKDYADNGFVHDHARMRMFAMPPSKAHAREYPVWGDYSGFDGSVGDIGLFEYHVAQKHDAETAWFVKTFLAGGTQGRFGTTGWPPSHRGMILAAILWDDATMPTPPKSGGAAWALDYHAKDLSLFLSRSGWDDGGALLAFKTGVFGGHWNFDRLKVKGAPGGNLDFGHDHDDDMNVWLFADGEWQTTNVPGYWIGRSNGDPEANRTRYANSLLVDGVGQLGDGPRNDSYDGPGNDWFFSRQSTIPIRGSTAHYSYVLGAGSQLYDAKLGLSTFGRSILFLDRSIPVVRDVVRGSGPHRYDVVWHALDAVEQEKGWVKLHAKNDRLLGVRVLAPTAYSVSTETQSGLRHEDAFDADDSMTAAFVHPTTDTDATVFLEALVPSRGALWSAKPAIEPLDPAQPDRGLVVNDVVGKSEAVMGDDPATPVTAGELTVTGMAGATRTVAGKILRAVLAGGSTLSVSGKEWIRVLKDAPATLEIEPIPGGVAISGETSSARVLAPGATTVTYNGVPVEFDVDGDYVIIPKSGSKLPTGDAGDDAGSNGDSAVGDAPSDATSSGCGCSTPRSTRAGGLAALAFALALLTVGRRR